MLLTIQTFLKTRALIFIFLAFYLLFSVLTFKDFGLTMDEKTVYTRGQYFYYKLKGNDPSLQITFATNQKTNINLLYYNSSYPAFLYALNKDHSYEGYHLLNLLFAGVIFYLLFELLFFIYKNPFFAIIGPLFLFFTPDYLGSIPANPKDVPFSIIYFASLVGIYFSRFWNEKIRILVLGILFGIAAMSRFIGFSLLIIYFIYQILPFILNQQKDVKKQVQNLLLEITIILLVGFLVFLINMPYIAADPFNHLIELVKVNKDYPWGGLILFFGKEYTSATRPISYLPLWIIISTPIFLLFLFISSFFKKYNNSENQLKYLIYISLGVHVVLYLMLHPVIYNGIRHYLFFLPQIIILATMAFIDFWKSKKYKVFIGLFVVVNILFILLFYIQFHPYEYSYFNAFVGGNKGAYNQFRLDYWGASDKEAMLWLNRYLQKTVPQNKLKGVRVYSCAQSASTGYYLKNVTDVIDHTEQADYIICFDHFSVDDLKKKINVTLLHTVSRDGVPYNFIFKVNR